MGSLSTRQTKPEATQEEPDSVDIPGSDLRLPTTGLTFSAGQLRLINRRLHELEIEHRRAAELTASSERSLERLVQKLVRGAAAADPRFSCTYLVVMHRRNTRAIGPLEYVAVLDALSSGVSSTNGVIADAEWCEGGTGELRVCVPQRGVFDEFLTPAGFLRRDKLLERWVELLAGAGTSEVTPAATRGPPYPVDPLTLRLITETPGYYHCFCSEGSQADDDMEENKVERVALSSAGSAGVWVRVRAGAGEFRLGLAASRSGPIPSADWPTRLSLSESHAPYVACSDTGWLAMCGVGGSGGVGAGWPLWGVGAERLAGLSPTARRLETSLLAVLHHLKEGQHTKCGRIRAVSRYLMLTSSRWHVEKLGTTVSSVTTKSAGNAANMRLRSAAHLSRHVLLVLDSLVEHIRRRSLRHWLLPTVDVLRLTRRPDSDWRADADCLTAFLTLLDTITQDDLDRRVTMPPLVRRECLELAMLSRWTSVTQELCSGTNEGLIPNVTLSTTALSYSSAFSQQQIQYIAFIARQTLDARKVRLKENQSSFKRNLLMVTNHSDPFEDLLDLLTIVLVQARECYLRSKCRTSLAVETAPRPTIIETKLGKDRTKKTVKAHKVSSGYDKSACRIAENLKNDIEIHAKNLSNDLTLVKVLIDYLYRSIHEDKKRLYPVLKPYLDDLYLKSSENCWFLEEYKWKDVRKEVESLGEFSRMVCELDLDPAEGLVDAARKDWVWAQYLLELSECIELTFVRPDGVRVEYEVTVPRGWSLGGSEASTSHRDRRLRAARRCVTGAFTAALRGDLDETEDDLVQTTVVSKSSECLQSASNGKYWNNSSSLDLSNPASASLHRTLRPKDSWDYLTLRSVGSASCATLDFPITDRDSDKLVADVGARSSAIDAVVETTLCPVSHSDPRALLDKMLQMQKYTVVQELCGFLGGRARCKAALRALHALRRGARGGGGGGALGTTRGGGGALGTTRARRRRTRSSEPALPDGPQRYTPRPLDYMSGDERPSRRRSQRKQSNSRTPNGKKKEKPSMENEEGQELLLKKIAMQIPPNYDSSTVGINYSLPNSSSRMDSYTGVIHYSESRPKYYGAGEKRAKSLSRAFSSASRRPPLPSAPRRTLYDVTPPVTSPPSRTPSFASHRNPL